MMDLHTIRRMMEWADESYQNCEKQLEGCTDPKDIAHWNRELDYYGTKRETLRMVLLG